MDETLVFRKTPLALAELGATRGHLSSHARRVLILLDGQRPLGELIELLGSDAVRQAISELEARGYAQRVEAVAAEAAEAPDDSLVASTTRALPPTLHDDAPDTVPGGAALDESSILWSTTVAKWGPGHAPPTAPPAAPRRRVRIAALALLLVGCVGAAVWALQSKAPVHAADQLTKTDAATPVQGIIQRAPEAAATVAPPVTPLAAATPVLGAPEAAAQPPALVRPTAGEAVLPSKEEPAPRTLAAAESVPAPVVTPEATALTPITSPADASEARSVAPTPIAKPQLTALTPGPSPANAGEGRTTALTTNPSEGETTAPTPKPSEGGTTAPSPKSSEARTTAPKPSVQIATAAPPAVPTTPDAAEAAVTLHARRKDPPAFPARALRAGVSQGRVVARIWVTPEGSVDQVDIVSATPPHVFDDEVRKALSSWRFDPPGQSVNTTVELSFTP